MPMKRALDCAPGITGLAALLLYAYPRIGSLVPGLRRYHYWREWPTSTISEDLSPTGEAARSRFLALESQRGRTGRKGDPDR
jgi:hypothetical protein